MCTLSVLYLFFFSRNERIISTLHALDRAGKPPRSTLTPLPLYARPNGTCTVAKDKCEDCTKGSNTGDVRVDKRYLLYASFSLRRLRCWMPAAIIGVHKTARCKREILA